MTKNINFLILLEKYVFLIDCKNVSMYTFLSIYIPNYKSYKNINVIDYRKFIFYIINDTHNDTKIK